MPLTVPVPCKHLMPNDVTVVDVQQTVINGKRFYKAIFDDGAYRLLRSVTSVTKGASLPSFLDEWKMQQVEALGRLGFSDAMTQVALDGTIVHKAAELHIGGTPLTRHNKLMIDDGTEHSFDDDTWPKYQAFCRWMEKRKPEFIWTEETLYSLAYGFAGRSDGSCLIDGKVTIIDFKTAKRVQDDHKQQGCAYLIAASEMGQKVEQVLILCLGAENKQGYTETLITSPYDIHNHFMGFYHKLNLVNWANPKHV